MDDVLKRPNLSTPQAGPIVIAKNGVLPTALYQLNYCSSEKLQDFILTV